MQQHGSKEYGTGADNAEWCSVLSWGLYFTKLRIGLHTTYLYGFTPKIIQMRTILHAFDNAIFYNPSHFAVSFKACYLLSDDLTSIGMINEYIIHASTLDRLNFSDGIKRMRNELDVIDEKEDI